MNRFLRRFAIASVAAVALAACASDTDSTPGSDVGQSEFAGETLTIYSGRSESLVAELFTQFTAQTGIELNVRYGDSGELASLILTEGNASPADLYFSQDAGGLGAVGEAGLLAALPNDVLEQVDERFRSTSGQWVATSGRVRVVVYNPDLVPTPPAGIDDLVDPQWKGKIGFAPNNASWQSFVTALRVIRGEDAAREWLQGFAANKPVAYEKNGVVRDAVNTGEVSLGLVNHYYLYEKIAAEGADAVVAKNHYFTNGDVGGLVNIAGIGMVASTKKQAAALVLVRFLLSAQGQQYFAMKTFEYTMAAGVVPNSNLPNFAELNPPALDLSDLSSIEATQQLLEEAGLLTR